MRGRSLASSSAEAMDPGNGVDLPETTDSPSSADWDVVVGTDSGEPSASSAGAAASSGTSSPKRSMLGAGWTACAEETEDGREDPETAEKTRPQPGWRHRGSVHAFDGL